MFIDYGCEYASFLSCHVMDAKWWVTLQPLHYPNSSSQLVNPFLSHWGNEHPSTCTSLFRSPDLQEHVPIVSLKYRKPSKMANSQPTHFLTRCRHHHLGI